MCSNVAAMSILYVVNIAEFRISSFDIFDNRLWDSTAFVELGNVLNSSSVMEEKLGLSIAV